MLKEEMKARGLTYRELAKATRVSDPSGKGLTYSYLAQMANRRVPLTAASLRLVASALDLDEREFLELRAAALQEAFAYNEVPSEVIQDSLDLVAEALANHPLASERLADLLRKIREPEPQPLRDRRVSEILDAVEPFIQSDNE